MLLRRIILIILFFGSVIIAPQWTHALTRQLPLSGQLLTPAKMAVPDGDYTMRFAIYDKDRTSTDPYPSDADSTARIWTETQTVKVERGLWKVTLGSATALPDSLNFETGNYYLGIRINTDPEMVPRKKILPVPLALNAESLGGAKPGAGSNDILQLDSAGAINIAGNITTAGILQGANLIVGTSVQLPANSILTADIMDGTISTIDLADGLITSVKISDSSITSAKISDSAVSGAKLADSAVTVSKIGDGAITTIKLSDGSVSTAKLADLSVTTAKVSDLSITAAKLATGDLHFQNTDTGTTSLVFGLGTGTAIGTNNFSITASNAANKPAVRYNGTSGKWQISNDGATFADIASAISATLQGSYDAGNTITTTDGRNILFTLADTATDSSFLINIQGTGNSFQIQDAGTPIFTVADGGISTFGGNINLSGNRIVSTSRIDGYPGNNFMSARVDLTYGSYSSIILDSSDLPHIAYQRNWDDLSIADWDGAQWTITNIDTTGDRGEQADFVIDNAGVKHISYSDNYTTGSPGVDDDDLMYAKYVGTGGNCSGSSAWQCTLIDATGNIGNLGTSIDFDASNNPHISYYDQTNTNLKHAWYVGGGSGTCAAVGGSAAWNCEIVEAANDVGRFSAIVINRATGDIHITYFDNTNSDLRYIKYSGSAWGASDLLDGRTGCIASGCATSGTVGGYSYGSNLILDSSGNPRIAYYNASGGDLYYASYNGTAWTTSIVEGGAGATGSGCATSGDYGERQSLDLDSNNNPHIAYHVHSGLEDLRYASYSGSSWTCQTIDSSGNLADFTSIQATTANKIYISYSDSTNSDLKLASNNYPKLNIYGDVAIMGETGNLGIGTLAPTERLEVVGGIKASGNISGDNITASNDLTANDDLIVSDDGWIPTLFGSSSNNGALTLNSTSATPKGDIYINPGGQKTVIGNSIASASLATAGLQITPNYLYLQYRYYNPGTGYTYSGNTAEANSYGGTPFTLVSAIGDMAYLGSYQPFGALEIDLAALGAGGAVAWEYWNGAWVSLAATDGTTNFTADGVVSFTPPADWVANSVNSYSAYWIRANVTTTGYTTVPTANSTIIGRFGTAAAPLVASLIQPAGIADSTSWSATGTMLGINTPSSFNGNFVDLQVNGSSKFAINSLGNVGIGTNPASISGGTLRVNGDIEIIAGTNSDLFFTESSSFRGNFIYDMTDNAIVIGTANASNAYTQRLKIYGEANSPNVEFVNIANVGIGTSGSPGEKLEVVGNIISKGTSWTSRTSAANNDWLSVAYGNGLFVAVATTGTNDRVMTSPDGINWTLRTSAANNEWRFITYGNGLFVAVASSGAGNRVMTSPDGINWTTRTSAADSSWRSVAYGNGLFVAVACGVNDTFCNATSGNRVMTSPDGITWTSRADAADNEWRSITYGNGLFVAVATTGTANRVMTSSDGVTWTTQANPVDNAWQEVTYGNGLFVAVSTDGTGNRVMTSPNGTAWTSRTSAADNDWSSVAYGNGLFVAVACGVNSTTCNATAGNRVMTSPDGITWTSRTSAADNSWNSVAYGNGMFVTVANTGTSDRVMTSGKTELNALAHNNIYQGGMNIFGNVVIGIPGTTGNIFELKGVAAFEADNSNQNIYIQNTSGVNVGKINSYPSSVVFAGENNADAYFTDDSLNGIIVKDGGNVGINLSSPTARLHVQGAAAVSGTGTISSSGTTVTGVSTAFDTELVVGDTITASGQTRIITVITDALTLITDTAFSPALSSAAFTYQKPITKLADSSGNVQLMVNPQGNVGIGTTTPMTGVGRDQAVESGATIYSGSKAAFLQIKGAGNTLDFSSITLESDEATDKAWQIIHRKGGSDVNKFMWWYYNGTTWAQKMVLDTGGNLGLTSGSSITIGQNTNIITNESSYNLKFSSSSGSRFVLDSDNSGTGDDFNVYRVNTSGTPLFNIQGAGTNVGNVGINTSTPSGNLDIRQIADGNQVIYARRNTDTSPTGNFIQFQNAAGTSNLFIVNVNGFLGLGATPDYRLDVREGSGGSIGNAVRLQNNGTATNNSGTQLLFAANRTTSGLTNIAGVSGIITDITDSTYKGALILSTADNAAPAERARIDNVGNVSFGVNVTSGTTTVDLGGTGTGNAVCHTTQTGTDNEGLVDCTSGPIADYAEMYPVAGGIDYGDIVAVGTKMLKTKDGDNIVQLVKSSAPYQSTTIGIVSNNYGDFTSAGYNIKKEDNPMPVALNGRVPVKVSLENGPIAVGDPLTSSSTPGVAMKATGVGYVIGKALESIDESGIRDQGSGKILVFVNPGWYTPSAMYAAQGGEAEFAKINIGGMATVGDLVVAKSARFEGTLTVLDDAIFAGNVLAQKEVRVGGKIIATDVDLSGGLIVQKSARFENDLEILGTALFRGPAEFDQAVKLNGGLDVQGQAKFATDINVIGNITADKGVFNELLVSGPVVINGDLSLEGKIVSDLKVEKDLVVKGLIKAKGIVGGWRSYENHFLNSKFENEFTVSAGGTNWEYHKIKLATDALAGSKAALDHSSNFKPADDENGATWRFMIRVAEERGVDSQSGAEFKMGLYADEQNYALIQNGTEPQTLKFITCAVGECTTTDNITVDPASDNHNYVIMIKTSPPSGESSEVKLLIDGQEFAKHATNVPADSILHFREEITTNIDASQSVALDYLGVIVGRYEPF